MFAISDGISELPAFWHSDSNASPPLASLCTRAGRGTQVRADPITGVTGDVGEKPYPRGGSRFSSDDPRWKDLGITVGGIGVSFPDEDDL